MSDPATPLLRARGVRKYFPIKRGVVFQREVACTRWTTSTST